MIKKISIALKNPPGTPVRVFPSIGGVMICDEVDGLGPVPAQINRDKVGLSDGTRYNSHTLHDRNIVLHWSSVRAGQSVSAAKDQISHDFPPGTNLIVKVGTSEYATGEWEFPDCYVEAVEPDFLGTEMESGMQMSIISPNPFCILRNGIKIQQLNLDGQQLVARLPGGDSYIGAKASLDMEIGPRSALTSILVESSTGAFLRLNVPGLTIWRIKYDAKNEIVQGLINRPQGGPQWTDISTFLAPGSSWAALALSSKAAELAITFYGTVIGEISGSLRYPVSDITQNGV